MINRYLRKYVRKLRGLLSLGILAVAILPLYMLGCADMEQFKDVMPSSEFSVVEVPNVELDMYAYAKQKVLTTVPADVANLPHDIAVESLAVWGVNDGETMAIGIGMTFDTEQTARDIYPKIKSSDDVWKFLRSNNLYVVKGNGVGSAALQNAIKNNDFKNYDDKQLLEAANLLPQTVRAKLIGIAMAKPSKQMINFAGENIDIGNLAQIKEMLNLANLELIIGGLYSPNGINIAKAMQIARGNGNLADLNVGVVLAVKSSHPAFLVEPTMKKILLQQGLVETKLGELTLYKGYLSNPQFEPVPVFARIEHKYLFVSISGQEAYAEALITSIYK
jgi:hypothetical protein